MSDLTANIWQLSPNPFFGIFLLAILAFFGRVRCEIAPPPETGIEKHTTEGRGSTGLGNNPKKTIFFSASLLVKYMTFFRRYHVFLIFKL